MQIFTIIADKDNRAVVVNPRGDVIAIAPEGQSLQGFEDALMDEVTPTITEIELRHNEEMAPYCHLDDVRYLLTQALHAEPEKAQDLISEALALLHLEEVVTVGKRFCELLYLSLEVLPVVLSAFLKIPHRLEHRLSENPLLILLR